MNVAAHERRHAYAAACAMVFLGVDSATYKDAVLHIHVGGTEGEVAIERLNAEARVKSACSRLMAFGPAAGMPRDDLILMFFEKRTSVADFRLACPELSAADLNLVKKQQGPELQLLTVALAVQLLERVVGRQGLADMDSMLREASIDAMHSRDHTFCQWSPSEIVPYHEAKIAVQQARSMVHRALTGEPV